MSCWDAHGVVKGAPRRGALGIGSAELGGCVGWCTRPACNTTHMDMDMDMDMDASGHGQWLGTADLDVVGGTAGA